MKRSYCLTPKEVRTEVSREARDEVENENGEDFFKLLPLVVVLLTALPIGEEESNRIIAKARVSLTMVADSRVLV